MGRILLYPTKLVSLSDIARQLIEDRDTVSKFKEEEIGYKVFRVHTKSIPIIQNLEIWHKKEILWYDLKDPDISKHVYIVAKIRAKAPIVTYKGNEPEVVPEIRKQANLYGDCSWIPRKYRTMCAVAESLLDKNGHELDISKDALDVIELGHAICPSVQAFAEVEKFHRLILPDFFDKDDSMECGHGINFCKTQKDAFIFLKGYCLCYYEPF